MARGRGNGVPAGDGGGAAAIGGGGCAFCPLAIPAPARTTAPSVYPKKGVRRDIGAHHPASESGTKATHSCYRRGVKGLVLAVVLAASVTACGKKTELFESVCQIVRMDSVEENEKGE